MLHMVKLAVGVRDVAHLRKRQSGHLTPEGQYWHGSRSTPKRADEITDGGSIYWVIGGNVLARQRVEAILQGVTAADSRPTAILALDPAIVEVQPRAMKAFQGWRYLEPEAAPPDLEVRGPAEGVEEMPEALRRELRALGLL